MTRGILRFVSSIAIRCVFHRCESQDIHRCELFLIFLWGCKSAFFIIMPGCFELRSPGAAGARGSLSMILPQVHLRNGETFGNRKKIYSFLGVEISRLEAVSLARVAPTRTRDRRASERRSCACAARERANAQKLGCWSPIVASARAVTFPRAFPGSDAATFENRTRWRER